MKRTIRVALWTASVALITLILVASWTYGRPIKIQASAGMTLAEVRQVLEEDEDWDYFFYNNPKWCTRGIFDLGEFFSYHTWIGFSTDRDGVVESANAYHAVTIDLPLIGFHDHEFPQRPAELAPQ